ncbi:thioredoxin [Garciella nitratireducens DSM 15102]|uniref:Thioredoxin n=2 Tax=Garciella TaxID=218204 RepID=A0A1T4P6C6_9FIRM|nr:thioredoxin [Garciella nitratireducens]SJZ87140.1 thioredoxin [Garciella nitratireducens DSM 15102]
MTNEKIVILTEENFQQEVEQSDIPVMVDFWAEWCGPCKAVSPIIDELAEEYAGKIKVGKVNVDDQGALSTKFRVMSIPTIIFFKNGKEIERLIGARGKEEFAEKLDNLL